MRRRLGCVLSLACLGASLIAGSSCSNGQDFPLSGGDTAGGNGGTDGGKDSTASDAEGKDSSHGSGDSGDAGAEDAANGGDATGATMDASDAGQADDASNAGDASGGDADASCGNPTMELWSGAAGDLAEGSAMVVFVGGGNLYSVPVAGGNPTTLYSGADAQRLVLDQGTVYFTAGSSVMSVPANGSSAAVTVATGAAAAGALAVDATHVYWLEATTPPQIAFAPKAGGGSPSTLVADAGAGAIPPDGGSLALQGGTLYWLDAEAGPNGRVLSAATAGGAPVTPNVLASGGNGGLDLQLLGTGLYWTDDSGGYSMSILGLPPADAGTPLDGGIHPDGGGGPAPTSIPGLQNQFVVDAQNVYVLTASGTVLTAPRNVWAYQEIYCGSGPASHGRITADAVNVYFTTDQGVFATAK